MKKMRLCRNCSKMHDSARKLFFKRNCHGLCTIKTISTLWNPRWRSASDTPPETRIRRPTTSALAEWRNEKTQGQTPLAGCQWKPALQREYELGHLRFKLSLMENITHTSSLLVFFSWLSAATSITGNTRRLWKVFGIFTSITSLHVKTLPFHWGSWQLIFRRPVCCLFTVLHKGD